MRKFIIFTSLTACLCACRHNSSFATRIPFRIPPSFPGLDSNSTRDLSGQMESTCRVMENPFGGPRYHRGDAPDHFDSYMTTTRFYDSSGYCVRAANVKLNGIPVCQDDERDLGYSDPSFGITHHWQVTSDLFGFESVPAINDSILSPNYYRVTYPRPIIDTVSKSAGFTCTYDNPGTDSVTLIIGYDSVMTIIVDSSNHPSYVKPRGWVSRKAANTGSYFVSGSLLDSFPSSGVIQMWVNTFRSREIASWPDLGRRNVATVER